MSDERGAIPDSLDPLRPENPDRPNFDNLLAEIKIQLLAEFEAKKVQTENHYKRLQNLRKELDYIEETEWCYEPIEKHIGQT